MASVRQQINSCLTRCLNNDEWTSTNDAIDYLFQTFPENGSKNEVITKLVCIDRIYRGSLYRLGLRSYTRELNKIAEAIISCSATIDRVFTELSSRRKYNPKFRDSCIEIFDNTMELLYPKDRSVLLSKYFHFHAPHFFPMLDRFASTKLWKVLDDLNIEFMIPKNSSRYCKFYVGIEALYLHFNGNYSFRDLDIYLYGDRWLLGKSNVR